MRKDSKAILERITEKIKVQYKPEKIILFGSYAYGKPTKDSDIDLFIIKNTKKRHCDRALEVRTILDRENRLVSLDLLVYTANETKRRLKMGDDFIGKIMTQGVILYE
ncbi:MAG: nucleotidyltransferase domain-containing protein [Elusimicrobia bacterium]|nr:nucleotidyltransferase domain-containing protein [Elusimicrobiota bacterium]